MKIEIYRSVEDEPIIKADDPTPPFAKATEDKPEPLKKKDNTGLLIVIIVIIAIVIATIIYFYGKTKEE